LNPETKFLGGDYDQTGVLRRRHVQAIGIQPIGKEADNLEENEFIGEDAGPLEYSLASENQNEVKEFVSGIQDLYQISHRALVDRAKVSHRTLSAFKAGRPTAKASLSRLVQAADRLRQEAQSRDAERSEYLRQLRALSGAMGGRNKLATGLEMDPTYLGRVLRGEKPISDALIAKLNALKQRRILAPFT
jgi:hypothetical protein